MPPEQIHMSRMETQARRSVMWAFIANTIPKKRSHAITVRVRILDTRDRTENEQERTPISNNHSYNKNDNTISVTG